jgi:hypothetical protein
VIAQELSGADDEMQSPRIKARESRWGPKGATVRSVAYGAAEGP